MNMNMTGPLPMRLLTLAAIAALTSGCAHPRAVAHVKPLRVLVYNIHAGKDAGGVDNLERVATIVRLSGADVVLLQEVDSATRRADRVDQLATLAARTQMHGVFGSTIEWQGGSFGLAILARSPIRSHRLIPLPTNPPQPRVGYTREPRGVLMATIDLWDGPLAVMNTHLDASTEGTWRDQQVTHLVALADSLRRSGARVLLGGDLNARPSSEELRPLSALGFRDSWTICGQGAGFTFPSAAPVRRIDYLFLPPGASCTRAEVLADEASDHRAVLVEIRP